MILETQNYSWRHDIMNEEWELNARKEGYDYFDEPFDGKMKSNKYKHEMYLNTGFWWFRKNKKEIIVFTDKIADIEYLYTVFTKETHAMIYYCDISQFVDMADVLNHYKGSSIEFIKINFDPDESVSFLTRHGKRIHFKTLVLASDDTVIFDMKSLGLKKGEHGNRQVYRIKDKNIHSQIKSRLLVALNP